MKNSKNIEEYKRVIWNYYQSHKRAMPWRPPQLPLQKNGTLDAYAIFISEVMLQQTQVSRVMTKYPLFIQAFPSFEKLANAPLSDVLLIWQGMGYNRRAKFLKSSAEMVISTFDGTLPDEASLLEQLPGIGPATARSIVTFTYNKPELFIETNIRRVMIYHFFPDSEGVDDRDIIPYIDQIIDKKNPREWYYALMDYGTWLAKGVINPNRKSKHYTKQSKFEGSNRQIRGEILRLVLSNGTIQKDSFSEFFSFDQKRIYAILDELVGEQMIFQKNDTYSIDEEKL